MNFPCTGCGACCRNLPPVSPLNTGSGICRHLDLTTQRCAIYETRPLICRVDDLYQERLSSSLAPRMYYLLQAQACVALDESNAALPQEAARLLALETGGDTGGKVPAPLSEEELTEALTQVMAVAGPLIAQG